MQKRITNNPVRGAFSLVETLVVITISSMLIVAALQIYQRVRGDAAAVSDKLTENQLAVEILQRIAEDCDRLAAPGFDAQVMVQNKTDHGYRSGRLLVMNKYYQRAEPPRQDIYEQVIWQSDYDPDTDSLLLYRAHSGLNFEDKILDASRKKEELGLFIPVAEGLTCFEVQAVSNQTPAAVWTQLQLPQGLRIGISFWPPEPLEDGAVGVPEDKIVYRTIAVDRTRAIAYQFESRVFDVNDFLPADPNDGLLPNTEESPKKDAADAAMPEELKNLLPGLPGGESPGLRP